MLSRLKACIEKIVGIEKMLYLCLYGSGVGAKNFSKALQSFETVSWKKKNAQRQNNENVTNLTLAMWRLQMPHVTSNRIQQTNIHINGWKCINTHMYDIANHQCTATGIDRYASAVTYVRIYVYDIYIYKCIYAAICVKTKFAYALYAICRYWR